MSRRPIGGELGEPSSIDTGELDLDMIERALQREDGEKDPDVRKRLIPLAKQLEIINPSGHKTAEKLITAMRQMISFRRTSNETSGDVQDDMVPDEPAEEPLEDGKTLHSEIVGALEELRAENAGREVLPVAEPEPDSSPTSAPEQPQESSAQRDNLPTGNGITALWNRRWDKRRFTSQQRLQTTDQLIAIYRDRLDAHIGAGDKKSEGETRETLGNLAEEKFKIETEIRSSQPAEPETKGSVQPGSVSMETMAEKARLLAELKSTRMEILTLAGRMDGELTRKNLDEAERLFIELSRSVNKYLDHSDGIKNTQALFREEVDLITRNQRNINDTYSDLRERLAIQHRKKVNDSLASLAVPGLWSKGKASDVEANKPVAVEVAEAAVLPAKEGPIPSADTAEVRQIATEEEIAVWATQEEWMRGATEFLKQLESLDLAKATEQEALTLYVRVTEGLDKYETLIGYSGYGKLPRAEQIGVNSRRMPLVDYKNRLFDKLLSCQGDIEHQTEMILGNSPKEREAHAEIKTSKLNSLVREWIIGIETRLWPKNDAVVTVDTVATCRKDLDVFTQKDPLAYIARWGKPVGRPDGVIKETQDFLAKDIARITQAVEYAEQLAVPMTETESKIARVVESFWKTDPGEKRDYGSVLKQLRELGINARFASIIEDAKTTEFDKVSSFGQGRYKFARMEHSGAWLIFTDPTDRDQTILIPAEASKFSFGYSSTYLRRYFEGFQSVPVHAKFNKLTRFAYGVIEEDADKQDSHFWFKMNKLGYLTIDGVAETGTRPQEGVRVNPPEESQRTEPVVESLKMTEAEAREMITEEDITGALDAWEGSFVQALMAGGQKETTARAVALAMKEDQRDEIVQELVKQLIG